MCISPVELYRYVIRVTMYLEIMDTLNPPMIFRQAFKFVCFDYTESYNYVSPDHGHSKSAHDISPNIQVCLFGL